jgi:hypothetical protein
MRAIVTPGITPDLSRTDKKEKIRRKNGEAGRSVRSDPQGRKISMRGHCVCTEYAVDVTIGEEKPACVEQRVQQQTIYISLRLIT